MHTESLVDLVRGLTLAVVPCTIAYKYHDYSRLRKTRLYVKLRLFTFYSSENIIATTNNDKRKFMARGNFSTAVVLGCLLPNSLLGAYDLANLFKNYLDGLF